MRVAVLGAGSLGSIYGAWLAEAGADVVLLGRPGHVDAIARDGLIIESVSGLRTVRPKATDDPGDVGDADLVLVATKAQDTPAVLAAYPGDARAAFSVQNGVGQADALVERFGRAAVGCVSMVGGTLLRPGWVAHTLPGVTYLGDLATTTPGTAALIASAFPPEDPMEVRDDISFVMWSKAVLAVAAMGVSSLVRLPYHRVFALPGSRTVFLTLIHEAASVAAAEGAQLLDLPGALQAGTLAQLPRPEALARLEAIGAAMVAAGQETVKVSMLQSIESDRPLEVDAVFGDVLRRADRHGLDVPVLRAVTGILQSIDADRRAVS